MPAPTDPVVTDPADNPSDTGATIWTIILAVVIVGVWVFNLFGLGARKLEVVTSVSLTRTADTLSSRKDSTEWILRGEVRDDGTPVPGAQIWAIATDSRGNHFAPGPAVTDAGGRFALGAIPRRLGDRDTVETGDVRVFAKARIHEGTGRDTSSVSRRGGDMIRLSSRGQVRWLEFQARTMILLWFLPVIFLLTIILALMQARPDGALLKVQYYGSVLLAFLFTLSMLGSIGLGLCDVNGLSVNGEVLTLGFANIFQGTYVNGVQPEWLFSLTAPSAVPTPDGLVHGFGAPLWVIFISVIGAAVFTVSIFIKHVKDRISFSNGADVRERFEQIVRHQFYILFAPLGAVVVYQLLVVAGGAGQQVTVALATMAAGIAINAILDRAVESVRELITARKQAEKEKEEGSEAEAAEQPAAADPTPPAAPGTPAAAPAAP